MDVRKREATVSSSQSRHEKKVIENFTESNGSKPTETIKDDISVVHELTGETKEKAEE